MLVQHPLIQVVKIVLTHTILYTFLRRCVFFWLTRTPLHKSHQGYLLTTHLNCFTECSCDVYFINIWSTPSPIQSAHQPCVLFKELNQKLATKTAPRINTMDRMTIKRKETMYLELKQGTIKSEAIPMKFLCFLFIAEERLQDSFKLLKAKKKLSKRRP